MSNSSSSSPSASDDHRESSIFRRLGYLPVLRSIPHSQYRSAEQLYAALNPSATMKRCLSLVADGQCLHHVGYLEINQTLLISHAGSATDILVEDNPNLHLILGFDGECPLRTENGDGTIGPGGVMVLPSGLRHTTGSHSLASITVTPQQLATAFAAMAGQAGFTASLARGLAHFPPFVLRKQQCASVQSLVRYIDHCNGQLPNLPSRLGLDDLLHRHVAALLRPELLSADPADLQRIHDRDGNSSFDELIDYIRANLDQPLRLSDLEARSHYSRRALQYAFRQRLDCTPKQFIREQRLAWAMSELQRQGRSLTVRQVLLACGYHHAGHFTRDFHGRFGILPSQVRRDPPGADQNVEPDQSD